MTILTLIRRLNLKRTCIASTVMLVVFSILIGFILVPTLIRSQLKNGLMLKPNSEIRKMWAKAPFAVTFKVYIFNITNPMEVMDGGKPHVQQIGPYIFDEWKEKDIIEDDETSDTVTFDMKNTFVFRPDLTVTTSGLTGDEIVTIPHLLIMGGLIAVQRDMKPFLNIAIKALTQIFNPSTPFLTGRVMDILFDGISIDCNHDEFEATTFCSKLRGEKSIKIINETHIAFSILGGANATSVGRLKVYRGMNDISKLGEVVSVNDEEEMDVWDGDCNKILGTDSTIFAPFHQKTDVLYAFAPDLCRSLGASYMYASHYDGVPTGFYSIDFGDMKSDASQHCYCRDQDVEKCPPRGTIDLYPCNGAPFLASKPQFLDADEKLVRNVDGLNPNRDEHDIFLHVEMISTSPLSAAKRLQFALEVEHVQEMTIMSKLRTVTIPLVWVEESVHLNSTYTKVFRGLYLFLNINSIIKYTFAVFGTIGLIITVYRLFSEQLLNKVNNLSTQSIPPLQQTAKGTGVGTTDALPSVETATEADGKARY